MAEPHPHPVDSAAPLNWSKVLIMSISVNRAVAAILFAQVAAGVAHA
jgi:hypothetical protein